MDRRREKPEMPAKDRSAATTRSLRARKLPANWFYDVAKHAARPASRTKTEKVVREAKRNAEAEAAMLVQMPPRATGIQRALEPEPCGCCGRLDDEAAMLLCDGDNGQCNAAYHWYCVNLTSIPPQDEEWFCPDCKEQMLDDLEEVIPGQMTSAPSRGAYGYPPAYRGHAAAAYGVQAPAGGVRDRRVVEATQRSAQEAATQAAEAARAAAARELRELQELRSQVEHGLRRLREEAAAATAGRHTAAAAALGMPMQASGFPMAGVGTTPGQRKNLSHVVDLGEGDADSSVGGRRRRATEHRALTDCEKADLQEKIDTFNDAQLDTAIRMLREELGVEAGSEDQVDLDLDSLPDWQQRKFLDFVDAEYERSHKRQKRQPRRAPVSNRKS